MRDGIEYELLRVRVGDGTETTVYVVRHPLPSTSVRVVHFPEPRRLDHWCAANAQPEAIVAGFFLRDPYRPLGELRIGGEAIEHEPVEPPRGPKRGCVHVDGGVRLSARDRLPADPDGDLVQAGPLLVSAGRSLIDGEDRKGSRRGLAHFGARAGRSAGHSEQDATEDKDRSGCEPEKIEAPDFDSRTAARADTVALLEWSLNP